MDVSQFVGRLEGEVERVEIVEEGSKCWGVVGKDTSYLYFAYLS